MSAPNDVVLFHYPFSPYARKIIWYLTLRQIPYAQCIQPPVMPRPDLDALGVKYRRIPVLSIGRDIYVDTRLILQKLEEKFPASSQYPALSAKKVAGFANLMSRFTTDAGVFARASQLIPPDFPVMKDEKFLKDRESFMGRSWKVQDVERQRPEALAHMRQCFDLMEELLGDGRKWIAGTEGVDLADIDGIWPFHWLMDLKLPSEFFSEAIYPKTYAWLARFNGALKAAKSSAPKPVTLKGPDAAKAIVSADFFDEETNIDDADPVKLTKGQRVRVWPIDSGFSHKDEGELVKLTKDEVVISIKGQAGKEARLHAPRWGFRITPADGGAKL